ncbi:MAG: N-acetyltransferase [Bacillota bacterium]
MTILQTSQLNDAQEKKIRELEAACAQKDGADSRISLDNGINVEPEMDCFFLLTEGDALTGVISVFAPTKEVAEISGCMHPEFRQQGNFRRLLASAAAEAAKHGYKNLLLVHEASMPDGGAIAQKWGLAIEHSEYRLRYTGGVEAKPGRLMVRRAREEDVPAMIAISGETFEETPEVARHHVESAFTDPQRRSYVAVADGEIVGLCGVSSGDEALYIFGLGVSPKYQGKGYGRSMVAQIVAELLSENRGIEIEVDSENARAFHLYQTSGFDVISQYDYYAARTKNFAG